ncbi:MAG TPA: hypothetical protein VGB42_13005, partial [Candidatus Thermoplasmatota archaeon]
ATNVTLAGGMVRVVAHVIDNHQVASVRMWFSPPNGTNSPVLPMERDTGNGWALVVDLRAGGAGDYTLFFEALDSAGHTGRAQASMRAV